ncbi:MAG: hypothetical protein U1F98_08345 [Verrucomicrobiota bacterium]
MNPTSPWKVVLATLVIFGSGVLTGGLLVNYVERSGAPAAVHPLEISAVVPTDAVPVLANPVGTNRDLRMPAAAGVLFRKDFLNRLSRELKLNPEQRDHIEKLIGEGQDRTRELWRVEWVETRAKIRRELTPDQQTRFEDLLKPRPPRHTPGREHGTNSVAPAISSNLPGSSL